MAGRATKEKLVKADPSGLLSILDKHGAQLHALLTRLTLRSEVAEDLLQELFLKLARAKSFSAAHNPRAYVFRAAIHLAFDWRRAQRYAEPLPTDLPLSSTENGAGPLDRLIDAEELEQVLDAMRYLSRLGRHVVVLRYLQQFDYAEIAEQLGKTVHQVRGLCAKALGQLRSMLIPAVCEMEREGTS